LCVFREKGVIVRSADVLAMNECYQKKCPASITRSGNETNLAFSYLFSSSGDWQKSLERSINFRNSQTEISLA